MATSKRRSFEATLIIAGCLLMPGAITVPAIAQTYSLSGTVRDNAGHGVPSATITARSVATGKRHSANTASDGTYTISDLPSGDYEVSAVAGELQAPPVKVTLAAAQTTDLTVSPSPKSD